MKKVIGKILIIIFIILLSLAFFIIAIEDHRFYEHGGIDIIAIGRAIFNDIKAMSFVEGGIRYSIN